MDIGTEKRGFQREKVSRLIITGKVSLYAKERPKIRPRGGEEFDRPLAGKRKAF